MVLPRALSLSKTSFSRPLLHQRSTPPSRLLSRPLTTSHTLALPRKDSQDKDSLNTEANEYTKSGTDDAAARTEDVAFNPDLTDPQAQEREASKKSDGSVSSQFTHLHL